jgi:ATP/maltotriose-dependent transcriptional regulator MalT
MGTLSGEVLYLNLYAFKDLLFDLLYVDAPTRCMFLQADAGYGKTVLLNHYKANSTARDTSTQAESCTIFRS